MRAVTLPIERRRRVDADVVGWIGKVSGNRVAFARPCDRSLLQHFDLAGKLASRRLPSNNKAGRRHDTDESHHGFAVFTSSFVRLSPRSPVVGHIKSILR